MFVVDVFGFTSNGNFVRLAGIPCANATEVMGVYADEVEFYKNIGVEVTHCEVRAAA